ncbi:MAG: DNA polymerase III subunit delta [Oscillospiraceae bacterium]|nr:DNA polymerase III subunit delta [Oscillospiraceae bacterium]
MAEDKSSAGNLQRLKLDLREKKTQRLYIFFGEEFFLLRHYLGQLKKLLIEDLTESFNYHKLTKENFDLHGFCDAVESIPMMAEHTLVWVDDIDIFKLPEAERDQLCRVITDIPDYCTVVFSYETVAWKPDGRLKSLTEAIRSNALVVEFPKQNHRDLIAWVSRHFAANHKQISPELCSYLIDITGGTMTALTGEISKICAYSDADTIVKSDIDAVTEPELDAVIFKLGELLSDGKTDEALKTLQKLLKMQHEPLAILGTIGSHFRRLGTAKTLLDNGKGTADLMRLCGIGEYPAKKAITAAKRFTGDFYATAAELILETDRQMKTSFDIPERLLEFLLLRLSQEARNG